ncbi:MAG: Peptidase inactive domain protein [Acidobacteria bacterium]|nr:Peptidase inactive domain protein [Acidobacteriota bacterium]
MTNCLAKSRRTLWAFTFVVLICCGGSALSLAQSQEQETTPALEGLDPVMLVQGKEVQGNLKITLTRGRFQYFFANEEDRAMFEKEANRYEIQLGGMCARMGAPVGGNPDLYTVHNGLIYIFGSGECKRRFEAAPEKYLDDKSITGSKEALTPEALKKGRELIDKAVTAMGSPVLIDSLTTFQEKSSSLQTRQGTEVEIKTNFTFLFPDRVRAVQVQPDYANPSVIRETAVVINANEGFAVTPNGIRALPEANRIEQQHELKRRPLAILRARKSVDFTAVAGGSTKVAEMSVEQVVVQIDGNNHTLGIDPTTGRIVSLTYRRRGPAGEFGEVVKVFSDFRTIEGVTLPFKVTATFNGQPWKEQSAGIESITINGKIDASLFEKPGQAKAQ